MVQEGLKRGVLVTWTKSFACPDGVGEDAVKMLEDAIARRAVCALSVLLSLKLKFHLPVTTRQTCRVALISQHAYRQIFSFSSVSFQFDLDYSAKQPAKFGFNGGLPSS